MVHMLLSGKRRLWRDEPWAHIWASRVLHRGEDQLVPHSVVGPPEQDGGYPLRRTTAELDGVQTGPGSKREECLHRWAKRPSCVDRPTASAPTTVWPPVFTNPTTRRVWEMGQENMQLVLNCRTYVMERNTDGLQISLATLLLAAAPRGGGRGRGGNVSA